MCIFFKKESNFRHLPDDVILEILKYLDLPFMKINKFYNPENDILLYEKLSPFLSIVWAIGDTFG